MCSYTKTVNETRAWEWTLEETIPDAEGTAQRLTSLNLKFLRLICELKLPEKVEKMEDQNDLF